MNLRLLWDEIVYGPIPQIGPYLLLFGTTFVVFSLRRSSRFLTGLFAILLTAGLYLILDPPDALYASGSLGSALFYAMWGAALAFGASRGFTPLGGAALGFVVAASVMDTWFGDQLSVRMPALWMADLSNRVVLGAAWAVDGVVPGSIEPVRRLLAPAALWAAENAGWIVRSGAGLIGVILLMLAGPGRSRIAFGQWRLGKYELLPLAVVAAMLMFFGRHNLDEARGLRLTYLAAPFAIQGLSVCWHAAERFKVGIAVRGLLLSLAFVPALLIAYAVLGLLDFLFDLRGLDRNRGRVAVEADIKDG